MSGSIRGGQPLAHERLHELGWGQPRPVGLALEAWDTTTATHTG